MLDRLDIDIEFQQSIFRFTKVANGPFWVLMVAPDSYDSPHCTGMKSILAWAGVQFALGQISLITASVLCHNDGQSCVQ